MSKMKNLVKNTNFLDLFLKYGDIKEVLLLKDLNYIPDNKINPIFGDKIPLTKDYENHVYSPINRFIIKFTDADTVDGCTIYGNKLFKIDFKYDKKDYKIFNCSLSNPRLSDIETLFCFNYDGWEIKNKGTDIKDNICFFGKNKNTNSKLIDEDTGEELKLKEGYGFNKE